MPILLNILANLRSRLRSYYSVMTALTDILLIIRV